ncbi:MAG: hypothetical protein Q9226_002181 [Calogaya cf. arnoldii]
MTKGSQNTRTITKKNNPFSGGRPGEPTAGKQRARSMESSKKKDVPRFPNGASLNVDTLSRNSSSRSRTEHRTFYNDPISVRQWAAETDPNTPASFAEYGFPETTYAADVPAMSAASQHPGSFPVSCSSVSHVSFPVSHGFPSDDLSATCAEAGFHGMAPDFGIPTNAESLACMDPMKNYDYEAWSYPTPTADDMAYTTATAPYLPYGEASNMEPRFFNWSSGAFPADDEFSRADYPCGPQSIAWPPLSATDPSVSSSYSQSSYLAMQSSTPLSPVAQEPAWPTGRDLSQEEENGFLYPAVGLGEAFPLPAGCQFRQNNDMSTMKPVRSLQRPPVSSMDFWSHEECHPPLYPGPSFVDLSMPRKSSDFETSTTAREHPLYQVGPKEDGLYHCPFAGAEDCSHKPEKLKCNYDKHLDSHLKPYRCKLSACSTLAFSSTACLLRHEREAHGMHGHGDKPHLCTYQDCERSIAGNGFPRRWNLFDHMRRVHNHQAQASSPGSTSPTPSSASSVCPGPSTLTIRKRRTSSSSKAEAMKRTKSNNSTKLMTSVNMQGNQLQSMQMVWHQRKAALNARMAALDPTDTAALERINADCAMLQTMAMNMRSQETVRSAH